SPAAALSNGADYLQTGQNALNIIIPMGGVGQRFAKEGYRHPKPLINIVGKPMLCWLIERLSISPIDTLWLAINEDIDDEFHIGDSVRIWFPKCDVRLVRLKYLTKGAAETVFIVTQSMPLAHRTRRTVSLDCDTIYFADILEDVRCMKSGHGGCFYFEDQGNKPIFSYIQLCEETGLITAIKEKEAISTKANTGAYVFPSAETLGLWAARTLDGILESESKQVGEYYTSQLISSMIASKEVPFCALHVRKEDFSCVGTPIQLEDFLLRIQSQDATVKPSSRRFCFDLDKTLVGPPQVPGDYSTCPPIWRNIKLARALHKAGHKILIHTARRMKTHNGNVGAIISDIGLVTLQSLERYGIPHDECKFGKPYADAYIDDLAVHANLDTFREIGWLAEQDAASGSNLLAEVHHARKQGMAPSRAFNIVQVRGEQIIKSSQSEAHILGEMYFYSHLPDSISNLFPQVHELTYLPETATYSITMQRLRGTTYSHMITGRSLTPGRLEIMLGALHQIHNADTATTKQLEVCEYLKEKFASGSSKPVNIYANYSRKLKQRFHQHEEVYEELDLKKASETLNMLTAFLERYEAANRALEVPVIHGDPVFSNIILNESERKVYFFDVRSQQGDALTMAGDVCYDLAKVLQSIQGYDHVMLTDEETLSMLPQTPEADGLATIVPVQDRLLMKEMQEVFWRFVEREYGAKISKQDILDILASLLFSLIPLHRKERRPLFWKMCRNVLE
ncbi:nucleotide-diphospho-sugar transferase, partial [Rhizodiscina lignyota]